MTKKIIVFVYIGNRFYTESGTTMGNFLEKTEDGYERGGLGDIENCVRNGYEVYVRPATKAEIQIAESKLASILRSRSWREC